jgi:hypothetical protein
MYRYPVTGFYYRQVMTSEMKFGLTKLNTKHLYRTIKIYKDSIITVYIGHFPLSAMYEYLVHTKFSEQMRLLKQLVAEQVVGSTSTL